MNTKVHPEDIKSKIQEPMEVIIPRLIKKLGNTASEVKNAVVPDRRPWWRRFAANHPAILGMATAATVIVVFRGMKVQK